MLRFRALLAACALVGTGTIIGVASQHLAGADVGSGSRPVTLPITPCRIADTRPAPKTVGVRSSPLGPRQAMQVLGRGATGQCNLRADAVGLVLNVTAVGATRQTNLRVFPSDEGAPDASHLNPGPGQPPTPNAVTTKLSSNGRFSVFNQAGSVHLVIDVVGILVGHHHDDRYYTKAQVDAAAPTLRTVTSLVPIPPFGLEIYEVACGPNEAAMSGGYSLTSSILRAEEVRVVDSFRGGWGPFFEGNVWAFQILNTSSSVGGLLLDAQCISTGAPSGRALSDETPPGWTPRTPLDSRGPGD